MLHVQGVAVLERSFQLAVSLATGLFSYVRNPSYGSSRKQGSLGHALVCRSLFNHATNLPRKIFLGTGMGKKKSLLADIFELLKAEARSVSVEKAVVRARMMSATFRVGWAHSKSAFVLRETF